MTRNTLRALFTVSLFILGSSAPAYAGCNENLHKIKVFFQQQVVPYVNEVKDTYGRRIVLKGAQDEVVKTKWNGFFIQKQPEPGQEKAGYKQIIQNVKNYLPDQISNIIFHEPGYRASSKPIYDFLIQNPVRNITQKVTGTMLQPTRVTKTVIAVAMSILVFREADAIYNNALANQIQTTITANHSVYRKAIQNDFRYNRLKKLIRKNKITEGDIDKEAYIVSVAYNQYYDYINAHLDDTASVAANMKLIDHYLFKDLKEVVESGVKQTEGFIVPASSVGKITDRQIIDLFESHHRLYFDYELISEVVDATPEKLTELESNPNLKEEISEILDSPFAQKLITLHKENKIDQNTLKDMLQEDAYWKSKFREWKIVNISKLKIENNEYTNAALTLEDLHSEMLESIGQ